jgi:DNA-binding Xre family transcriptional regulator
MTSRGEPGTRLRVEVLRALVAERRWTWPDLAAASGIHVSNVYKLVNGETRLITGVTMARLLHAFPTVRAEDLFDFGRDPQAVADLDTDTGSAA